MSSEEAAELKSGGSVVRMPSWATSLNNRARFYKEHLFSEQFAKTSQFVVSARMWSKTIPTRNCDVLMTFSPSIDDDKLMWLLARLRARVPELAVQVRRHTLSGMYGFYVTTSHEHLLRTAEELCIRKPVKSEYGGGIKEFVVEDQAFFVGVDDGKVFFTSQERQCMVRHMLFNLRAHQGDILGSTRFLEGQAIIPILLSQGIIQKILPLHNSEDLTFLQDHWVQAFFHTQPLDKICDYFGVKIALYFAYLGHYTTALLWPATLGILFWLLSGTHQFTDDVCFVLFALFNVGWATLYLEHWKRKSAVYAYRWGTLDKEDDLLVEPRALFHGRIVRSKVTDRLEPSYPAWKRNLFRYFVSFPVIAACLSCVFATMWGIFELQSWVNGIVAGGSAPFFFRYLPKVLLAISITLLDDVYKKIAIWLNNKENHRLNTTYEYNLIIKLVLFQFVNSFLSLFYIAFYLQDMDQLKDQLAALLITRQVIGNFKEAFLPYVIDKLRLMKIYFRAVEVLSPDTLQHEISQFCNSQSPSKSSADSCCSHEPEVEETNTVETDSNAEESCIKQEMGTGVRTEIRHLYSEKIEIVHSGLSLSQAEIESAMKKYEDTYEDYLEMLIQFGYVTLFSSAFPMAAVCALLNNIIEIRSDAFKLCVTFQRPFGERVESIGIWQHALEFMSVIAVMVNSALIGMSDLAERLFPGWGIAERIIFIVALEHIVLALKLLVAYAIPDIPQQVAEEKARLEFLRREALKKLRCRQHGPVDFETASERLESLADNNVDQHAMSEPEQSSMDPNPAEETTALAEQGIFTQPVGARLPLQSDSVPAGGLLGGINARPDDGMLV